MFILPRVMIYIYCLHIYFLKFLRFFKKFVYKTDADYTFPTTRRWTWKDALTINDPFCKQFDLETVNSWSSNEMINECPIRKVS